MAATRVLTSISSLPRPAASKASAVRLSSIYYLLPSSISSRRRKIAAMAAVENTSSMKCADSSLVKLPSHPTYDLKAVITLALAEDAGDLGNVTSLATVPSEMEVEAYFFAENGIIAGITLAEKIFNQVDSSLKILLAGGRQILEGEIEMKNRNFKFLEGQKKFLLNINRESKNDVFWHLCALSSGISSWFGFCQVAESSIGDKTNMVYETGELFELGIQLSYLLILLGLLGLGTFYVIRQVLVRRELDLSAKELQEQVRSGDATATGYFELGAVMLRRKFYPAAIKYLQQAIEKWDRDDQDLAQVYNALGVCYVRENKLEKGIAQFETAVKLQPGYITAWNNLGDAYEQKKDLRSAMKAFEEVLLFDPNNKVARPRRDALRERLLLFKGVSIKSEER